VSTEKGKFPERPLPSHESGWYGQGMSKHVGAMMAKGAKMLPVGAFVEGELSLSWMHFFQAHSCLSYFYSFILFYLIFVQHLIRGHCLGMVTKDDNVTHNYFRRNENVGSW
jgi:hypothetical protein